MWLGNWLIRAFVPIILFSGCGALRVAIPKEAQVFREQIIADGLSYSYSALEFGASNETQFKTWSVVKNLSPGNNKTKSHHEQGYEDSRWGGGGGGGVSGPLGGWKKPKKAQIPPPPAATIKSSPVQVFPSSSPVFPTVVYPQFGGFHPLLFSTPRPFVHFPGSTVRPLISTVSSNGVTDIFLSPVLTGGISVTSSDHFGHSQPKKTAAFKGAKNGKRLRKGKLRPVGLDHFNTGVQQALHISLPIGHLPTQPPRKSSTGFSISSTTTRTTTTANPFPKLSPGYSRVTQNLPNALPAVIYGTTNHLDAFERDLLRGSGNNNENLNNNNNNTWIPIPGPGPVRKGSAKGGSSSSSGGSLGGGRKGPRVLKSNKSRPRHRFSSNYSSPRGVSQVLKMRSHRLAGILSHSQKGENSVAAVYPNHHRNYSTVTARSRAEKTKKSEETNATTTFAPTTLTVSTGGGGGSWKQRPGTVVNAISYEEEDEDDENDEDYDEGNRGSRKTSTFRTTTVKSTDNESMTTESGIIHARITKIPNRRPLDVVVLNVTAQFPGELDDKVRARLKAIRKIVRRLP